MYQLYAAIPRRIEYISACVKKRLKKIKNEIWRDFTFIAVRIQL